MLAVNLRLPIPPDPPRNPAFRGRQPDSDACLFERVREACWQGDVKRALHLLHVAEQGGRPGGNVARRNWALRSIAACYARLGFGIDANDWYRRAFAHAASSGSTSLIMRCRVAELGLLHAGGNYTATVQRATTLLSSVPLEDLDRMRGALFAPLVSSLLLSGRIAEAEYYLNLALDGAVLPDRELGSAYLLLLRAELAWWNTVSLWPKTGRGFGTVEPVGERYQDKVILSANRALAACDVLQRYCPHSAYFRQFAEFNRARVHLFANDDAGERANARRIWSDWKDRGLAPERDLARVSLGIAATIHGRHVEALEWLHPLAQAALSGRSTPFAACSLFFAHVASERASHRTSSLAYATAYARYVQLASVASVRRSKIADLPERGGPTPALALGDRVRSLVERAADMATDEIVQIPSVEVWCERLAVPRRTLEYAVKRAFGVTPKHFLLERRLRLAAEHVRAYTDSQGSPVDTREELACIATKVGFSGYSTMMRAYEKLRHKAPQPSPAPIQMPRAEPAERYEELEEIA